MKKLSIILPFAILLASCQKEFQDTSFTPVDPKVSMSSDTLRVHSSDTTITVALKSNLPWMAVYDASWFSVTPARGKGDASLTITVKKNKYTELRKAPLKIKITDNYSASLEILQDANQSAGVTYYYVKVDGKAENSGLSWTSATTIDNAISQASPGDSILVAAGTYYPSRFLTNAESAGAEEHKTFEILENVIVMGGFPSSSNDDTTIDDYDPSVNVTTLSGTIGGTRAYHVVTVTAEKRNDAKAVLMGFNITGGSAQSFASKDEAMRTGINVGGKLIKTGYGGGLYIGESTVDVIDCNISENESGYYAGGCYIMPNAVVTMKDCQITGNNAGNNAGGIWNTHATLVMYGCTVSNNSAVGQAGGLYVSQFNTDKNEDNTPSICRIYNTTFANNSTAASMSSKRSGGACYIRATGDVVFVNCTFYKNFSFYGAGVEVYGNNTKFVSKTAMFNCTVVGNEAMERGGGVCLWNDYASLDMYNCIISDNVSGFSDSPSNADIGYGSAVKDLTHLKYTNSIVGTALYSEAGSTVSGWTFYAPSMLSEFGYHSVTGGKTQTMVPVSLDTNPAVNQGLDEAELLKKAAGFEPAIDVTVLSADQNLAQRNANFIGSCLAQ